MTDPKGRTVVTTGVNSGIGLATALEVARRGLRSVGTVRSEAKAALVAEAAARAGVEVETALLEVTDAGQGAEVIERYRPWALVNNAGGGGFGAIEDVDDGEARQVLETMVVAPARLARLALRHMRAEGSGRIVNVSSIFGLTTSPLTGWYAGAKHALEAVSDALRVEVASSGVRVVLVEPGGFRTGIWGDASSDLDRRAGSRYEAPYRRSATGMKLAEPVMGNPAQVAKVIARALSARRPAERYLVGVDARAMAVMQRFTPVPVRDLVTRVSLGL